MLTQGHLRPRQANSWPCRVLRHEAVHVFAIANNARQFRYSAHAVVVLVLLQRTYGLDMLSEQEYNSKFGPAFTDFCMQHLP